MRYRVTFAKRYQPDGQVSEIDPTADLDMDLADGVVAEKTFVERLEPASQHSQEVMDEDDGFLAMAAPEIWEYEVVDDRADEFEEALEAAKPAIVSFEVMDESETLEEDATAVPLEEGYSVVSETFGLPPDSGSPPDAATTQMGKHEMDTISPDAGGDLDELTVVSADDPNLGLTSPTEVDADWAADTGPTRNPDRGIATKDLTDKGSTLRPPKG